MFRLLVLLFGLNGRGLIGRRIFRVEQFIKKATEKGSAVVLNTLINLQFALFI